MEVRQSASFALIGVGYTVAVISLFLPWFSGRNRKAEFPVVPVSETAMRGPTILVLGVLTAGLAIYVLRGHVGLLGSCAAIIFNTSLLIWLFGSSISAWLPAGLLLDTPVFAIKFGVTAGLIGSLLILTGVIASLVEETWGRGLRSPRSWRFLVGLGVAAAALSSRGLPVLRAEAVGFELTLASDAIPVGGDALGLTSLALAVVAILVGIFCWRRLSVVLSALAGLHVGLSVLVVASGGLLNKAVDLAADRIEVNLLVVSTLYAAPALSATAALGALGLVLFPGPPAGGNVRERALLADGLVDLGLVGGFESGSPRHVDALPDTDGPQMPF